jgi:inorganic triphosphatase YgiF
MSVEREAKLVAPADFKLPTLDGLVNGIVAAPVVRRQLDATYYDSAGFLLARSGVTLRHRTGEAGPAWTLKLPGSQAASALVRRELVFECPASTVPAQAHDLLVATCDRDRCSRLPSCAPIAPPSHCATRLLLQ